MSIFSKIFGKKQASETDETVRVGGMEDFMTLIRVYYQSVMAAQLGISNINFSARHGSIQTHAQDSYPEQQVRNCRTFEV